MPMEEWWRQQYLSLLEYTKSLSAAASPKPEGPPEPAAGEICKHCELEIFPDAAFDWTSFGDPTCAKNTDGHEPMHPVEQLSAMLDAGGMLNMLHHDPIADVDLSHDPDQRRKEAATPGPHTENQPAERPEGGEGPTYPTVIIKCEGDRCNLCRPELPARPPANLDKIAKRIVHKFVYTNRFDRSNVQQVKDYVAEQLRQLLASPVPSAAPTCPICKSTDLTIYEHSGEFFLHCSDNQTHPAWRVETAQDLAAFFSPQASATPQEEK